MSQRKSTPERKLRLQHFVVQPVVVWDDGETLLPAPPVQPQPVTLEGLGELARGWPGQLAEMQKQADAGAPE